MLFSPRPPRPPLLPHAARFHALALTALLTSSSLAHAGFSILASFNGANGRNPLFSLTTDNAGYLYGTTPDGGALDQGTIFKLPATGGTLTTLLSFNGNNGTRPYSPLTFYNGSFYGVTSGGDISPDRYGTIYQLPATGAPLTTLYSFNDLDSVGYDPHSPLVPDSKGNLLGTTSVGGLSGLGAVYQLSLSPTPKVIPLTSFNAATGQPDTQQLHLDKEGNLYALTDYSASNNRGTLSQLPAGASDFKVLHTFSIAQGSPIGSNIVPDDQGNLYGTTYVGGTNAVGTIFRFNPATADYQILFSFDTSSGYRPVSGLIIDANGDLYGTTNFGGAQNMGVVFKYSPSANRYSILHTFTGSNGNQPGARLLADDFGNLYGTTFAGGANNLGVVYKLDRTNFAAQTPHLLPLSITGGPPSSPRHSYVPDFTPADNSYNGFALTGLAPQDASDTYRLLLAYTGQPLTFNEFQEKLTNLVTYTSYSALVAAEPWVALDPALAKLPNATYSLLTYPATDGRATLNFINQVVPQGITLLRAGLVPDPTPATLLTLLPAALTRRRR